MYTKEERALARAIVNDDMIELIKKVLSEKYPLEKETEKNVVALSNERYGEIMKVNFVARQHLLSCVDTLRRLAKDEAPRGEGVPLAPR